MNKKIISAILASAVAAVSLLTGCGSKDSSGASSDASKITLTNVSYDPTRELYAEYNELFAKHWKELKNQDVEITQSHGGSGKQALEVANGLDADVVTLALEYDVKAVQDAGLIEEGWVNEFDRNSSPYTSTIVFLVRKGNPKNIHDWDDIVKDGVGVITPNPKTSAGARGATTTFVENGQGDVLLAWENEAYLSIQDYPDDYEIITPSVSILAQPSVAVVDSVVDKRGTREAATEYLSYLYSDEAQRVAGKNYYRPSDPEILNEFADVFDLDVNLVTIDDFGGWDKAQTEHFADGGVFDQIYEE